MGKIHTSISFRTAILVFCASTLFFLATFGIMLVHSVTTLKEQALEKTAQNLELLSAQLNVTLEHANTTMYTYTPDDTLFFENREQASKWLKKAYKPVGVIESRAIIENGEFIAIELENASWPYATGAEASFYEEAARSNRTVLFGPYYSKLLANRAIGIVRSIPNPQTGCNRLILCEMKTQSLFENLTSQLVSSETIVVLKNTGETVFIDPSCSFLAKGVGDSGLLDITDSLRTALMHLPEGSTQISADGNNYIVQQAFHEQNWQLFMLIDPVQFYAPIRQAAETHLFIAALAVLALTGMSLMLSRWVLHPVRLLARQMDSLSVSKPLSISEGPVADEISMLKRSFNRLMQRLSNANMENVRTERERYELEYRVLQSQIQPHFLFNIHTCCQALIKDGKTHDASVLLYDLDMLLRQSIQPDAMLPLSKEIELCQIYIDMNKMRMGDRFDFIANGWETYKDVQVPKLLIQPILENALHHGFVGQDVRGEIRLEVEAGEGVLYIVVEDNGRGIPEDKLAAIQQGHLSSLTGKHSMVSIGLDNVHKRIQHAYGKKCGLFVFSKEGIGTRVEMVIGLTPVEHHTN